MRIARTKNKIVKIVRCTEGVRSAVNIKTGMQKKSSMLQCLGKSGAMLGLLFAFGFAGTAFAFDGQPAADSTISPQDLSAVEALRTGVRQYNEGNKTEALTTLRYAAEHGQPSAAWKLGEMYASGDGVQEDDLKAFQYYSQIVREHGEDGPDAPDAPFVASAFVALGSYYLDGIDGAVPKNERRARHIFTHAASYFGDAEAQYELGRMYQDNNSRMAVRWYNLAALKGHVGAQARLGETLYSISSSEKKRARGLMWMTIAREQTSGAEAGWINDMHEQYFALSPEPVRKKARSLANGWLEQNRSDLLTAQQLTTQ